MIDNKAIHNEAIRQCGHGTRSASFELGAEWAFSVHPRINKLAEQSFNNAIIRGKTSKDATHADTFFSIFEELREFREASEVDPSEHLPQYTASVEELADIAISALTELYARVDNVEEVIVAKINYNKTRV